MNFPFLLYFLGEAALGKKNVVCLRCLPHIFPHMDKPAAGSRRFAKKRRKARKRPKKSVFYLAFCGELCYTEG